MTWQRDTKVTRDEEQGEWRQDDVVQLQAVNLVLLPRMRLSFSRTGKTGLPMEAALLLTDGATWPDGDVGYCCSRLARKKCNN